MAVLFDQKFTGSGSVATLLWVDLGLIPVGSKIRFGACYFGSPQKSITFNLRSNLTTKSAGTTADAALQASYSVGTRTKPNPYALDLYKNNTLDKSTVVGTGVERVWLHLTAKGSLGSYNYTINYMVV